jgi:cell division protein FtsQ
MRLLKSSAGTKRANAVRRAPVRRRHAPKWRGPAIRFGLAVFVIAGLGAGIGWGVRTGQVEHVWKTTTDGAVTLTAEAGLRVDEVLVVGRRETLGDDLLAALDVARGTPILSVDLVEARDRVLALPWVKSARIERRLPDALFVEIEERIPLALWQRDGVFTMIDQDGDPIHGRKIGRFAGLPIVIGDDVPQRASEGLAMLATEPNLASRVTHLSWIGNRRWSVRIDHGISIELPELEPAKAWARLAVIERERGVLNADVHTVDLRLPDQLIFRTTPEVIERVRAPGRST